MSTYRYIEINSFMRQLHAHIVGYEEEKENIHIEWLRTSLEQLRKMANQIEDLEKEKDTAKVLRSFLDNLHE